MSAIKQYGRVGGMQLQAGWTIGMQDDGLVTGQATFEVDSGLLFASLPPPGTPHPEVPQLQSFRCNATASNLKIAKITVDYVGLKTDPTQPKFSFHGSLADTPIEAHPKFVSDLAGTPDSPLNGAKFDDTGKFVCFNDVGDPPALDMTGVTTWEVPGLVCRATFYSAYSSKWGIAKMGKYVDSPSGMSITLPPGMNWLVGPTSIEPYGKIYKISQDYILSGWKGVNQRVYTSGT